MWKRRRRTVSGLWALGCPRLNAGNFKGLRHHRAPIAPVLESTRITRLTGQRGSSARQISTRILATLDKKLELQAVPHKHPGRSHRTGTTVKEMLRMFPDNAVVAGTLPIFKKL